MIEPPKVEPPVVEPPKVQPLRRPRRPRVQPPTTPPVTIIKRPRKPMLIDEGPDLPWPCWLVRSYAAGKTEAELEAMRVANGVAPLSPKQRRQAQACLAGMPRTPRK
jgi:hypothetical protein